MAAPAPVPGGQMAAEVAAAWASAAVAQATAEVEAVVADTAAAAAAATTGGGGGGSSFITPTTIGSTSGLTTRSGDGQVTISYDPSDPHDNCSPSVSLVGIEVTQSVQDLNNSVPLITGKSTYVRAYLQSAPGGVPVSGVQPQLVVSNALTGAVLGTLTMDASANPGGAINVGPNVLQHRTSLDASANFALPSAWLTGVPLFLTVQGLSNPVIATPQGTVTPVDCNSQPLPLAGAVVSPGGCSVQATFQQSVQPQIMWLKMKWQDSQGVHTADDPPFSTAVSEEAARLAAIFPIASPPGSTELFDITALGPIDGGSGLAVLQQISEKQQAECPGKCPILYFGVFTGTSLQLGSRVGSIGGTYGYGTETTTDPGDTSSNYTDGAHEISHLFNLVHPVTNPTSCPSASNCTPCPSWPPPESSVPCSYPDSTAPSGLDLTGYCPRPPSPDPPEVAPYPTPDWPYVTDFGTGKTYTISPSPSDPSAPNALLGFDTHPAVPRVTDPTVNYEVTSHCGEMDSPPQWGWVSDVTYKKLLSSLMPGGVAAGARPAAAALQKTYQVVEGTLDLGSGSGTIGASYMVSSNTAPANQPTGKYTISLRAADGSLLQQVLFSPDVPPGDPGAIHRPGLFIVAVPSDARAVRIELSNGSSVLDSRVRSPQPPQVSVSSPNGGRTLAGSAATFAWTASSPQGNALTYTVQLSSDCGTTYQTLATNVSSTSLSVALAELRGTSCALLRVRASDGFNSTEAVSGQFSIPNQPPSVTITAPGNGATYVLDRNQVVNLAGSALDPQDGTVADSRLIWQTTDTHQNLGSGSNLQVPAATLGVGTHPIALSATDSVGLSASATVTIRVVATVPTDTTPPSCTQTGSGITPTGKNYLDVTAQDTGSGLRSVTPLNTTNIVVDIPSFGPGTLSPVVVRLTKVTQSQLSHADLQLVDLAGNHAACSFDIPVGASDTTPPTTTLTWAPTPNPAGWNNRDVLVSLFATDNVGGSGLDATYYAVDDPTCTPTALKTCSVYAVPFYLHTDGKHTVSFFSVDQAGNREGRHTRVINVDETPPHTDARLSPPANAAGWNNQAVSITLTATDNLSGVDHTEFNLDATGWTPYITPVVVRSEGKHVLQYRSIDVAGNDEVANQLPVNIDLTPPEASIQFNPATRDIVVTGHDALSGTSSDPVQPANTARGQWDADDEDADLGPAIVADGAATTALRTYQISDAAGNTLSLVLKVRTTQHQLQAHIISLQYNSAFPTLVVHNAERFVWTLSTMNTLDHLDQRVRIGAGRQLQAAHGVFNAGDNTTRLDIELPGKADVHQTQAGLVLLQTVTNQGSLSVTYQP